MFFNADETILKESVLYPQDGTDGYLASIHAEITGLYVDFRVF
jgi:hypothetical protein